MHRESCSPYKKQGMCHHERPQESAQKPIDRGSRDLMHMHTWYRGGRLRIPSIQKPIDPNAVIAPRQFINVHFQQSSGQPDELKWVNVRRAVDFTSAFRMTCGDTARHMHEVWTHRMPWDDLRYSLETCVSFAPGIGNRSRTSPLAVFFSTQRFKLRIICGQFKSKSIE